MRAVHGLFVAVAVAAFSGCGGSQSSIQNAIPEDLVSPTPNTTPADPPSGNAVSVTPTTDSSGPPATPVDPQSSVTQPDATTPVETETVVAEAGVGKQGRSLDEFEGAIVTPVKAYFSVRERTVFEIQIPQAVNLYKATNGQSPQSHDEFMQQIVQNNQIKLPELPAGHKYVYDPKTEQLMVERPR